MSNEVNPATTGDEPILNKGPTVEIEGREYQIRRLGIRDTFEVAKIIGAGASAMGGNMSNKEMLNLTNMSNMLLAGVMAMEKVAFRLLASLINVSVQELADPEKFPMGSELQIIEALIQSQDLKAFLALAGDLMNRLPEMQTASRAASTN